MQAKLFHAKATKMKMQRKISNHVIHPDSPDSYRDWI